jgi:hypothetical protein
MKVNVSLIRTTTPVQLVMSIVLQFCWQHNFPLIIFHCQARIKLAALCSGVFWVSALFRFLRGYPIM